MDYVVAKLSAKNKIFLMTGLLFRLCFLAIVATGGFFAASAQEETTPGAPHLLPEDTLAYVRLDHADDFRNDLDGSGLGRMLSDPQLKPFSNDLFQTLSELFEQVGSEFGLTLGELLAIPSGQVAAAAMPANLSDQQLAEFDDDDDESDDAIRRRIARKRKQQNAIAGVFLVESAEHLERLRGMVDRLEQRLSESGYVRRASKIDKTTLVRLLPPRTGRPEIEYFEREETMVLGIGHQTASKVLDQWLDRSDEPTLAGRVDFGSVMSRCVGAEETRPQLTFFLDPYHLIERLVKRGGAAGFIWPIIEELGLAKIRGVGGSAFRGGEVFDDITHFHVLIDPPRDGFFGLLRPEIGETSPPLWVPSDVTSYTSIHWNFAKTYENLGRVLEKFRGPEPLKKMFEDPARKNLEIEFREEIIGSLTGRYVTCRWNQPPAQLNSVVQLHAFSVRDPVDTKAVIAKVRERYPNVMDVETIGGTVVYRFKRKRKIPDQFRKPEPCMMVMGDWVLFGDSTTFMQRVTMANQDSLPRLIATPQYELVSSELGGKLDGEKPFMISFLRGSEYIRQAFELAKSKQSRQYLRNQGAKKPMVAKIAAMLDRNELPPFEEFEKYFAPSGTFAYDEPTGLHLGTFTLRADDLK